MRKPVASRSPSIERGRNGPQDVSDDHDSTTGFGGIEEEDRQSSEDDDGQGNIPEGG